MVSCCLNNKIPMGKIIKFNNNIYLDSTSIVHNLIPLSDILNYSDKELKVGKWIDGKTLYRKSVVFGSFPNDSSKLISHNITNISQVCFYFYSWYDSEDNNWFTGTRIDSGTIFCKVAISPTNVRVEGRGTDWTGRTSGGHCDIYYTKTTD